MSVFSSYKKIFLLGFIIIILIAIPFSVYVAQKRQQITTRAIASTVLSFDPTSITVKKDEILTLGIVLNPGTGTSANQVSFVKLSIKFDPAKFTTTADSLTPNTIENTLANVIDQAQYDNTAGKATLSLSIGADPTGAVKTKTKIAILKLKATDTVNPTSPNITFDSSDTQVLSLDNNSQTNENVLSTTIPATITITSVTTTTETGVPPTSTPNLTSPSTSVYESEGGLPPSPLAPVCSSLEINGSTSGTAPYSLTFSVIGSDPNGTIDKISFNFGDSIQDLIGGGGIETSSVSAQISHTYNTPGIYTAYAILTDNDSNLSDQQANCTKTITVNSNGLNELPQPTRQPIPCVDPACGDGKTMLGLGALGIVLTIIGGVLLFL